MRLGVLLLLVLAAAGCDSKPRDLPSGTTPASDGGDVVTVFAAASTTNAIDEIKAAFTEETGSLVQTNYSSSSTLAQQIANGAQPDVYLSANVSWADYVERKVTTVKRRDLLGNRLVIVVPSGSQLLLQKPEDLLSAAVEHVALGEPESVPAGKYAKQALIALNVWNRLEGKIVAAKDVRQALTYVETEAAEAGIVYATDAAVSDKVRVAAEIPVEMTDPVVYPVILLTDEARNAAAGKFFEYLASPKAAAIFEKYGFAVMP